MDAASETKRRARGPRRSGWRLAGTVVMLSAVIPAALVGGAVALGCALVVLPGLGFVGTARHLPVPIRAWLRNQP